MGLFGLGCSIRAHVILKQVNKSGVKLAARIMVWGEGVTILSHLQFLTPLSTQQVETPHVFRYRFGIMVFTHLTGEASTRK